jgi:hypothetical protein
MSPHLLPMLGALFVFGAIAGVAGWIDARRAPTAANADAARIRLVKTCAWILAFDGAVNLAGALVRRGAPSAAETSLRIAFFALAHVLLLWPGTAGLLRPRLPSMRAAA